MATYILRRLLLIAPTLFGMLLLSFILIQFTPGGPVERVLAQLQGTDVGATARIGGSIRRGRRRQCRGRRQGDAGMAG